MIKDKIYVLDGGFSTQLSVHVGEGIDGDPLWSARFNATDPESITKVHLDFLNAGADIILTNTYQASVEGFTQYLELDKEQSVELIKTTVRLAHSAREKFLGAEKSNGEAKETPLIFGSIGPYGAHLHDGSEYTGAYVDTVNAEQIKAWHRVRIQAVIEAGVDGLAIETIPCRLEAELLHDLLTAEFPNVKFWISFQCKDDAHLAHGEDFGETAEAIWQRGNGNLIAVGVNCLSPQFVTPLFKRLRTRLPLVVYPNSGEVYDVASGWTGHENCRPLDVFIKEWIELGARFVGGCCRTYARDIARIRNAVDAHK